MAETVEGSFTFTVLDGQDNLYFVKGDSPLCICHFPDRGLYLYTSTRAILLEALTHIPCLNGEAEQVAIDGGELLMIGPDGTQKRSAFRYSDPAALSWFGYEGQCCRPHRRDRNGDYTRALKSVAGFYGISPDQIDQLLNNGFTHEEIEDYLYCREM